MNVNLDAALVKKYPKIFANRFGDPKETLMCWGFECGDGWYDLIDVLCYKIQSTIDAQNEKREKAIAYNTMLDDCKHGDYTLFNEHYSRMSQDYRNNLIGDMATQEFKEVNDVYPQVVAVQIKEKFAGLRFYVEGATEEIYNYISFAESMSYRICEECGSPGKRYTDGWHKTLCEVHADMNGRTSEKKETV